MKYFLDTEFLEGTQKKLIGSTKPTIDFISIGIVSDNDKEYYAIYKDFNIKEALYRYDLVKDGHNSKKVYWIRDNVLKTIYDDLLKNELYTKAFTKYPFTYKGFKKLIKKYGKSNKRITEEIINFIAYNEEIDLHPMDLLNMREKNSYTIFNNVKFYGYYSDYDWVAFCWLFGKMINLPKGFPMYCIDLKQTLDERNNPNVIHLKLDNDHNALSDAKFNFELYKFLNIYDK
jgi:hypothetical protein